MPRAKKTIDAAVEEVKKTGRKAKAKVEEAAEKTADTAAAVEVEVKKTTRSAGRKAKAKVEEAVEKVAGDVKDAAEKAKVAAEVEVGKAKAKRTRKTAEAKKAAAEAATKPARKARAAKLDIVIQSVMGGAITTEEIAAKVPKDAISAYVKVEENKIYWVDKKGETGDVEIW